MTMGASITGIVLDDLGQPVAGATVATDMNGGIAADTGNPLAVRSPHFAPTAKREIYLFMAGAPSQQDMLDYKPAMQEWFDKDLPESARVVKFVNLYKEFDADDDELTRTRKLRRSFVEKRYHNIVEALYSENDTVHIDTTITYEDGRQSHINTDLHIRKVAD